MTETRCGSRLGHEVESHSAPSSTSATPRDVHFAFVATMTTSAGGLPHRSGRLPGREVNRHVKEEAQAQAPFLSALQAW
jgi:hypothetical protein